MLQIAYLVVAQVDLLQVSVYLQLFEVRAVQRVVLELQLEQSPTLATYIVHGLDVGHVRKRAQSCCAHT